MVEAFLTLSDVRVLCQGLSVLEVPALTLCRSRVLAIMGPNGAGKSTLLRVLGLLQPTDCGRIFYQGEEVRRAATARLRRRVATVFQEPLLLSMSVYDNVALGLRLRGWGRRDAEKRVAPWLERLGIARIAWRSARTISGGEAQRTSLARALVLNPELLLLDEPFAALDPPTREALLTELDGILRETAITTVFVTHDRNEALILGDTIAVMSGGRILQIGSSEDVFFRPSDTRVAELVGSGNIVTGIVESSQNGITSIRIGGACLPLSGNIAVGKQVTLCVRPEEIVITPAASAAPSSNGHVRLPATVAKIIACGFHSRVILDCGRTGFQALVARPALAGMQLRPGDRVVAEFSPAAVHIIGVS